MQRVGSDRVVGLVIHELRTPVAIMKAYAQLLEAQLMERLDCESLPETRDSHQIAAHILEQADLMSGWVEAMQDVRRLQIRELPLERAPVDLLRLAWTVAEELQQALLVGEIEVMASRDVPPPVHGDRARLRQVLTNLVENACKYAACDGITIRVGFDRNAERASVAVRDTGPGLRGGELRAIFAPYAQGHQSSVGLGLGLYLSREIARLHGGDLWAESRGASRGSTFTLSLPVVSARVPTRQARPGDGRRDTHLREVRYQYV